MYDGWETRRRREPGFDEALIRLGAPGAVHGVVVDTAYFKGNYPPEVSVDATCFTGYPTRRRAARAGRLGADRAAQPRPRATSRTSSRPTPGRRWTHVRLRMFPDGGIARLRVHGEALPDPQLLDVGGVDLAALENGGRVVGCSNLFYSSPNNLISPGQARIMGEGWETARRRDDGNDWVLVRLAGDGVVRLAELDTMYFKGNAPGAASLSGFDAARRRRHRRPGRVVRAHAPAPARAGHPAPVPDPGRARARPTCGWTSTPTAAWPGCGCSAT